MSYEGFMRRAFKCSERSISKGTCCSIFEHLIMLENGTALYKDVSRQKQLENVKKWVEKGLKAFLKRNLLVDERQGLECLLANLPFATGSYDLNLTIEQALSITQPYNDWHYT